MSGEKQSILLVDDDASIHPLVSGILASDKRDFQFAATADDGLNVLSQKPVDLVLADLHLPPTSGVDFIGQVSKRYPDVPIIALTGAGSERLAVESFRAGASDYVLKGDIQTELTAAVNRILGEASGPTESPPDSNEGPTKVARIDAAPMKWADILGKGSMDARKERECTPERLEFLRRQAVRLEKSSMNAMASRRKHNRQFYADTVYIIPLDANEKPAKDQIFLSFCRNVSAGGCSLIHNRLISLTSFIVFFPYLKSGQKQSAAMLAEVVRDRPLALGLYDIGVRFRRLVELTDEDSPSNNGV